MQVRPRGTRLRLPVRVASLLGVALGVWGLPGTAAARGGASTRVVYVVVLKGKPSPKIVAAVRSELATAADAMGMTLVAPKGRRPAKVVGACGANLKCVVKVARPVKAVRVVYARAAPIPGGGVKIGFLTIGVRGAKIESKIGLTIRSVAEVKSALDSQAFAVLGGTGPGFLEVRGGTGSVLVDGKAVGAGGGPFEVPPGTHDVQVGDEIRKIRFAPGRTHVLSMGNRAVLFVVAKGVAKPVRSAVRTVLHEVAGQAGKIEIVSPREMLKAYARNPKAAILRCGKKLACIAGLADRVGADAVIYARLAPGKADPKATRMQFLVVGARTKKVERKVGLEVRANADLDAALENKAFEILGLTGPGSLSVEGATGEVVVDGKVVGEGPGPYEIRAGVHQVASHGKSEKILIFPGRTAVMLVEPAPPTPPIPPPDGGKTVEIAETVAAVAPEIDTPRRKPEPRRELLALAVPPDAAETTTTIAVAPPLPQGGRSVSLITYAGLAVGGLGLVAAGGGSIFAAKSEAKNTSLRNIRDGVTPGTQLEANRLMNEAQASANSANMLFMGGGIAVGVGLALMSFDFFTGDDAPEVSAAVGPGGAKVTVRMVW